MSELLNVRLVKELLSQKGLKVGWVREQIGLKVTTGTLMLSRGVLPGDLELREQALMKLAQILGKKKSELLVQVSGRAA